MEIVLMVVVVVILNCSKFQKALVYNVLIYCKSYNVCD